MTLKELRDLFAGDYTLVALFDEWDGGYEDEPLEMYDGMDKNLTEKFNDCRVIDITSGMYPYEDFVRDHFIFVHLDHGDVLKATRADRIADILDTCLGKDRDRLSPDRNFTCGLKKLEKLFEKGYLDPDDMFRSGPTMQYMFEFLNNKPEGQYWRLMGYCKVDPNIWDEPSVEIYGIVYDAINNEENAPTITKKELCDFANEFHFAEQFEMSPTYLSAQW